MVRSILIISIVFWTKCNAQIQKPIESCYFISCTSSEAFKRPSLYSWDKDSSTYSYSIISNSFVTFSYRDSSLFVSNKENILIDILKSDVEISSDFSLKVIDVENSFGGKIFKIKLFSTVSSGFAPQYYLFSINYGMLGFKNGFGTFVNPLFENKKLVCDFLR